MARQRLCENPPQGKELVVSSNGGVFVKAPKIDFRTTTQETEFGDNGGITVVPTGGPRRRRAIRFYRDLKRARKMQAQWRTASRLEVREKTINPECLPSQMVREVAAIKTALKERRASYGDRVFNFALAEEAPIPPIVIPAYFPFLVWQVANQLEPEPISGVPMLRVDALRKQDNSIAVIELNPCWVDNFAALAAFCEVYKTPSLAINLLAQALCDESQRKLNRDLGQNLGLVYCNQATGCRRDEIYGLEIYLKSTGLFGEIRVAPLREIQIGDESQIYVNGIPVSILYLNGSFSMAEEWITEKRAVGYIRESQAAGKLVLAPAQFTSIDQKDSLCQLTRKDLSVVMPTSICAMNLEFPLIAKPLRSQSLKGIQIIETTRDLDKLRGGYVFQEFRPVNRNGIICFDSESNTIFKPDRVFEKINIWIIGDQVVGVLATYFPTPLINDAGYNLPIDWRLI